MRILVATDAWRPQVNGVVRSLEGLARELPALGAQIDFLTPQAFRAIPMPGYAEIPLALATPRAVRQRLAAGYDHVHIATEGPIGLVARAVCLRDRRCFTTSFHTRFPEYIHARSGLPVALPYAALRRFHNAGAGVMVSTPSLARELDSRGFRRLLRWSRGVDHAVFSRTRRRRSIFRVRSFSMPGGSRSRKTLKPSCPSICLARNSSPATGRRAPR